MKRFAAEEIRTFLRAVDKHAERPFPLVIIGGAAAALSYGVEGGTLDIDTANNTNALGKACEIAEKETGLEIPLSSPKKDLAPPSSTEVIQHKEKARGGPWARKRGPFGSHSRNAMSYRK